MNYRTENELNAIYSRRGASRFTRHSLGEALLRFETLKLRKELSLANKSGSPSGAVAHAQVLLAGLQTQSPADCLASRIKCVSCGHSQITPTQLDILVSHSESVIDFQWRVDELVRARGLYECSAHQPVSKNE